MAYDGTLKFDTEIDVKGLQEAAKVMAKCLDVGRLTKGVEAVADSMRGIPVALAAVRETMDSMEKSLSKTFDGAGKSALGWREILLTVIPVVSLLFGTINTVGGDRLKQQLGNVSGGFTMLAAAILGPMITAVRSLGLTVNTALPIVGLLSAAILGIVRAVEHFNNTTPETEAFQQKMEALSGSVGELKTEIEDLNDADAGSLAVQAQQADNLMGRLDGLIGKEQLAAEEQARLEETVGALNDIYPDWNLQLDESNQLINGNTGEIIDNIDALKKQAEQIKATAKARAFESKYIELINQKTAAEIDHTKAINNMRAAMVEAGRSQEYINDAVKTFATWTGDDEIWGSGGLDMFDSNTRTAVNSLIGVNNSLADINETLTITDGEWGVYLDSMETAGNAAAGTASKQTEAAGQLQQLAAQWGVSADSILEDMGRLNISADEWGARMQEAVDCQQQAVGEYAGSATDAFNGIDQGAETSFASMQETLRQNRLDMLEWSNNLYTLAKAGLSEGLIGQIEEQGPAAARALVDELEAMNGGAVSAFDTLTATAKEKITTLNGTLSGSELDAETFAGNWRTLYDEAGAAITENDAIETAAQQKMEGANTAGVEGAGQFEEIGTAANEAAANGMENSNALDTAAAGAVQNAVTIADGQTAAFHQIGVNMVSGMAQGARNASGMLWGAMYNVVKQAVEKAKEAGNIHSPSKLFRDEVGRPIVEGIGAGIEGGLPGLLALMKKTVMVPRIPDTPYFRMALDVTPEILEMVRDMPSPLQERIYAERMPAFAAGGSSPFDDGRIMNKLDQINSTMREVRDKEMSARVSGRDIVMVTEKARASMGTQVSKGAFAHER